jgi:hypothetical protein
MRHNYLNEEGSGKSNTGTKETVGVLGSSAGVDWWCAGGGSTAAD